jgi:hypothetical protein
MKKVTVCLIIMVWKENYVWIDACSVRNTIKNTWVGIMETTIMRCLMFTAI